MSMSSTVSLSKILKYRKRVQNAIHKVTNDIVKYNVVTGTEGKEPEREANSRDLMSRREALVAHLIDLETRLNVANQPIVARIIKLRELKGTIAALNRVDTSHGPQRYGDEKLFSYATYRKQDIDGMIRKMELEIDTIQDEIDAFNATIKIELPNFGLANQ